MNLWRTLTTAFVLAASTSVGSADGDPVQGETVFRKCMACHRVGEGARHVVGPVLNGVIGRKAGTAEGYRYSGINQSAGEAGLIWDEDLIFQYLPDPQGFLVTFLQEQDQGDLARGRTRMAFRLADEQQRLDVVAYIKQFSDAPTQ
ncbi:c-type cytochrome [Bauldia sp.]|uniref:c-type cytochrome n=1 Tax=Bauldia sp. TaxID=2575872 RepID=UPI003BAA0292